MEPYWKLWLHLFKAEHFAKKVGEREECGGRCTLVAAPFKCGRVEASSTS
jgi:hypothetical protein